MMNYLTLPEIKSEYNCGIGECSDPGELSTGHQQRAPGTSHEGETEDQGKAATPSNITLRCNHPLVREITLTGKK